jgi:hypothetical protein
MRVPVELVGPIAAAMRWDIAAIYRDDGASTAGLDDDAVVKAWLRLALEGLMGRYALHQGLQQTEQAVETTREFYRKETEKKHQQTVAALQSITDATE